MARMRYIKPEYWTDSVIVRLSPWARLLYIGTWNFALCDHGHLEDDAFALKMKVFPADNVDVEGELATLIAAGRIRRLTGSDGRRYLHVVHLTDHQKTDPRFTPRCPACNDNALTSDDALPDSLPSSGEFRSSLPNSPTLSDSLPQEGKGGEGRGEEGKGKSATRSPRRRTPETPIPDDWSPNATARAKAQELGIDLAHEAQQFRNHALTHDRRCVRWDAAFLTWLGKTRPTARPARSTTDDRVRAGLALARELRAEQQTFPQIGAAS